MENLQIGLKEEPSRVPATTVEQVELDDGRWIRTWKGNIVNVFDPNPETFDIEDIAHHLSLQCRWLGAVDRHYSVAEHSVNCAILVKEWGGDKKEQLSALLCDAAEAYMAGLPRPHELSFLDYKELEWTIQNAINAHFGVPSFHLRDFYYPLVKSAKEYMLNLEAYELFKAFPKCPKFYEEIGPKKETLEGLSFKSQSGGILPQEMENLFLYLFDTLAKGKIILN